MNKIYLTYKKNELPMNDDDESVRHTKQRRMQCAVILTALVRGFLLANPKADVKVSYYNFANREVIDTVTFAIYESDVCHLPSDEANASKEALLFKEFRLTMMGQCSSPYIRE